jgi:hypothetical protein
MQIIFHKNLTFLLKQIIFLYILDYLWCVNLKNNFKKIKKISYEYISARKTL